MVSSHSECSSGRQPRNNCACVHMGEEKGEGESRRERGRGEEGEGKMRGGVEGAGEEGRGEGKRRQVHL